MAHPHPNNLRTEGTRVFRRRAARGVTEQHSRGCALSRRVGRRCSCTPTYVARVERDGRVYSATLSTLAGATTWAAAARDSLRAGAAPERARPAPTLADLAVSFLRRAQAGEALTRSREPYGRRTLGLYEATFRLHVLPQRDAKTGRRLGDLPADALDVRAIQAMVDALTVRAGTAVARHAGTALAACLRDAYGRRLLEEPPPRVLLPPPPAARTRTLTPAEADRLLAGARADDELQGRSLIYPLLALLAGSGCRISEALGLGWGPLGLDLRSDPPRVSIRRETTKTDAGVRTVLLDRETSTILREHYLASGRPADGAPVFVNMLGRRADRHGCIRRGVLRAARAAGLPAVSRHVLRHAHATWLAASPQVANAAAARRLGHADATFFQRRYVHPGEAEDAAALAALEAYRAANRAR